MYLYGMKDCTSLWLMNLCHFWTLENLKIKDYSKDPRKKESVEKTDSYKKTQLTLPWTIPYHTISEYFITTKTTNQLVYLSSTLTQTLMLSLMTTPLTLLNHSEIVLMNKIKKLLMMLTKTRPRLQMKVLILEVIPQLQLQHLLMNLLAWCGSGLF